MTDETKKETGYTREAIEILRGIPTTKRPDREIGGEPLSPEAAAAHLLEMLPPQAVAALGIVFSTGIERERVDVARAVTRALLIGQYEIGRRMFQFGGKRPPADDMTEEELLDCADRAVCGDRDDG